MGKTDNPLALGARERWGGTNHLDQNLMSPKEKGDITELIILTHLMKLGYLVSIPFGQSSRYDLLVDLDNGHFKRIQCKTGKLKAGGVVFNCCSNSPKNGVRKSYLGQADCFMVYCPDNKKIYEIPITKDTPKNAMTLRIDEVHSNSKNRVCWAKDYEI